MERSRGNDGLTYTCQSCDRPDQAEPRMIACDNCRKWQHLSCAGVDSTIDDYSNLRFTCKGCRIKVSSAKGGSLLRIPSTDRSTRSSTRKGVNVPSHISSERSVLEAQLKVVEEQQQLEERELEEQAEIQQREIDEVQRSLEERKSLLEAERQLRERQLAMDKEVQARQQQIRKESLEKKSALIRQMAESSSRGGSLGGSIADSNDKVATWLKSAAEVPNRVPKDWRANNSIRTTLPQDQYQLGERLPSPCRQSRAASLPAMVRLEREVEQLSIHEDNSMHEEGHPPHPPMLEHGIAIQEAEQPSIVSPHNRGQVVHVISNPRENNRRDRTFHPAGGLLFPRRVNDVNAEVPGSPPGLPQCTFQSPILYRRDDNQATLPPLQQPQQQQQPSAVLRPPVLTPEQIAARQVLGKELPIFNGNPEDWSVFISSFEQSTGVWVHQCQKLDTPSEMLAW